MTGFCFVTSGWSDKNNWRDPGYPQEGSHPVVCVSPADAKAYVEWLSARTGKRYRLPSEAEWEYAARGNTVTGRYWGWENADACQFENTGDVSGEGDFPCTDGFAFTAPVGIRKPNPFGLYDMLGNVAEWVEDCASKNYEGAPIDGSARTVVGCEVHTLRSASWGAVPWAVRSAHRGTGGTSKYAPVGFRVARDE
jgi:formylglycine-generating enzyme required for sulfatase activity